MLIGDYSLHCRKNLGLCLCNSCTKESQIRHSQELYIKIEALFGKEKQAIFGDKCVHASGKQPL
jgi:hypothetical protein